MPSQPYVENQASMDHISASICILLFVFQSMNNVKIRYGETHCPSAADSRRMDGLLCLCKIISPIGRQAGGYPAVGHRVSPPVSERKFSIKKTP